MGKFIKTEATIREYLLGRVSDETTLEGIEDLLFTDEEFCSQLALVEDDLINDYVFGNLSDADEKGFQETLARDAERLLKVRLTEAVREKAMARKTQTTAEKPKLLVSLKAFFSQPAYVGALAMLLLAVAAAAIYFNRKSNADELAELRSLYQTARPTETRISQFDYAPLTQLRGEPDSSDKNRLRRIENNLIGATETNPDADTHHALGVFRLTQQEFGDAIKELETAVKLADKNAKFHNDLGAAYFELSRTAAKENKLKALAQSLDEFTKATELDSNSLEALFNKSLALQQMGSSRQAKESWTLYLQKDPSSPWAAEARKNLTSLNGEQTLSRRDTEVLSDFLTAYRSHNDTRAQRIHDETKGLPKLNVSLQLSRRYLLAKQTNNETEAKESVEAMAYIGNYEQTRHSEFFFLN